MRSGGPAAAIPRQHKDLSRRDPVKVAQHFSAGMLSQRSVRPVRTIDTIPYCFLDLPKKLSLNLALASHQRTNASLGKNVSFARRLGRRCQMGSVYRHGCAQQNRSNSQMCQRGCIPRGQSSRWDLGGLCSMTVNQFVQYSFLFTPLLRIRQ
jgi:hypothetical protein